MKETDTISVLICVHSQDQEHDNLFCQALESLVRQTYDDFEVVLVLDECWSSTRRIAEDYGDVLNIRLFERAHKQGLAAAKNYGLAKCTGDWIAYLDADDQYMDCKLEVQRNWLLKHPQIDFCSTHAWDIIDGYVMPNCFGVREDITHSEITKRLPNENIMCHGSMMIRRVAIESLGGYNIDKVFLGREDWELWMRALNAGFTFGKVPERLYLYSLGTSVPRQDMCKVVHCKKSSFDVYVGRPTKWGNPFSHKGGTKAKFVVASREEAVEAYRQWILTQDDLLADLHELKGKTLACWCAPQSCHADVLLELANQDSRND